MWPVCSFDSKDACVDPHLSPSASETDGVQCQVRMDMRVHVIRCDRSIFSSSVEKLDGVE
jgi:hypothetical protein